MPLMPLMPELFGTDLERGFLAVGLGTARTVPVVWLIPAFGGQSVPSQVRVGLGLALSLLCLPRILGHVPAGGSALFWILLLAREVAVGVTIGFLGSCLFRAAEAAGRLTDILRGANMAEVISPVSEGRTSPLGDLSLLLAVVIFLELGGPGHVALALSRSYDAVPLTLAATPASLAAAAKLVAVASAQILESAVGLAAPAVVALLLADLVLGAVARAAPQIPVYFVGMPLKALGGVGVVLISLAGLEAALVTGFRGWATLIERAVSVWR